MLPSPEIMLKITALGTVLYWIWKFITYKKRAENAEQKLYETEVAKKVETQKADINGMSITSLVARINSRRNKD